MISGVLQELPMREYLIRTSHSPRPLPSGRWQMTQRWNDLLFVHWPVPASQIAPLLPEGLEPDVFQGSVMALSSLMVVALNMLECTLLGAYPGARHRPLWRSRLATRRGIDP